MDIQRFDNHFTRRGIGHMLQPVSGFPEMVLGFHSCSWAPRGSQSGNLIQVFVLLHRLIRTFSRLYKHLITVCAVMFSRRNLKTKEKCYKHYMNIGILGIHSFKQLGQYKFVHFHFAVIPVIPVNVQFSRHYLATSIHWFDLAKQINTSYWNWKMSVYLQKSPTSHNFWLLLMLICAALWNAFEYNQSLGDILSAMWFFFFLMLTSKITIFNVCISIHYFWKRWMRVWNVKWVTHSSSHTFIILQSQLFHMCQALECLLGLCFYCNGLPLYFSLSPLWAFVSLILNIPTLLAYHWIVVKVWPKLSAFLWICFSDHFGFVCKTK